MAADLHIHVIPDEETLRHVEQYMQREYWTGEGEGYNAYDLHLMDDGNWYRLDDVPEHYFADDCDWAIARLEVKTIKLDYDEEKVYRTDAVWIGEVSWLKAGLFEDNETFIPGPIQKIAELCDGLPIITEEFITQIMDAFNIPNTTGYDLANPKEVEAFLRTHIGKRVFHISW